MQSIHGTSNQGTQNSEGTPTTTERSEDRPSQDGDQSDSQDIEDDEAFDAVEDSTTHMSNLPPEHDITTSTRELAYEKLKLLPADADLPECMERALLPSQQAATARELIQVPRTHGSKTLRV